MIYECIYKTPIAYSDILMISDGEYLTGLWFMGSKETENHSAKYIKKDLPVFRETCKWLDIYYSGTNPNFVPKFKILNLTPFRQEVLDIIRTIPYGSTMTYNDIAETIAKRRKIKKMSAQAVGGAVGKNPISIIIPCHRVVGTNGNLTGYSGGIKNKIALLAHEQNDLSKFLIPKENNHLPRCKWVNENNPLYIKYHDEEWGVPNFDEHHLYEMLILETFQAGLSWECVLNKRKGFNKAFDNFDINKICNYNAKKINELLNNKSIIRNKLKINATITNSRIFKEITNEFGSFHNYLLTYTHGQVIYEIDKTTNELSDALSKDLQKRGMKFVGSTIIYSYLQAIGIINSHEQSCFKYKKEFN